MIMNWLPYALTAALSFAAVNHIDKYLLSKYFKGRTTGALLLFSACIGIPVSVLIAILSPQVFDLSLGSKIILVFNGAFYLLGLLPYFYALDKDETSIVAPLFQMVSVFSALLGVIFLGERLYLMQWLGCVLIFLGGVALSMETSQYTKIRIKYDVLRLMVFASFIMAFNGFIFKLVAVQTKFWTAMFWEYTGYILFASLVYIFIQPFREEFLTVLRQNNLKILGVNGVNEVLAIVGKSLQHFATMLTPLAIAFVVHEGAQPFFVLLIGIFLTVFFPKISQEDISKKVIIHKFVAVGVMVFGVLLLS